MAYHGAAAYHSFTRGGGLEPRFITGVSPITMDDVTGGFSIGTNISVEPDFNEMVGFTELEVRHLVETYRELGVFNQDAASAMGIMGEWYNGYRSPRQPRPMANEGEWRPAFKFLGEAIARQTGIRDYIAGEKVMAPRAGALGFLAAYLSVADYYVLRSEAELGKGHADTVNG